MVQSLCNLVLVGRGPPQSELGRGEVAVGGVGPVGVVVAAPVVDDHPGFQQRVEAPRVELIALSELADDLVRRMPLALLPARISGQ